MPEIKIVYVDDQIDPILSKYIGEVYCVNSNKNQESKQNVCKIYEEVEFKSEDSYENLLKNVRIRSANVILIDNHLFQEGSARSGRFSGKQFKVIFRKLFPFVEVLIITQDDELVGNNIIHKYSNGKGKNPNEYYKENLDILLNNAIEEVVEFESLADDLKESTDVEKILVERILQSLQGDGSYDSLNRDDINGLVSAFRELRNIYGN